MDEPKDLPREETVGDSQEPKKSWSAAHSQSDRRPPLGCHGRKRRGLLFRATSDERQRREFRSVRSNSDSGHSRMDNAGNCLVLQWSRSSRLEDHWDSVDHGVRTHNRRRLNTYGDTKNLHSFYKPKSESLVDDKRHPATAHNGSVMGGHKPRLRCC